MRWLSTFFPKHARPRTVVHAGPLLLRRDGGERALRRFLRVPRKRELFLVHHGQAPLHHVAKEAGVTDITVDASAKEEADCATEMALALGARRLDFTIDEPCVVAPDGSPLREIDVREAERLAADPEVRPRIRAKLRAGCSALRNGVTRVRIGDPPALTRGRATVLRPDLSAARQTSAPLPRGARSGGAPRVAAREPCAAATGRRHYRVGVSCEEPYASLHSAWWRLRGRRRLERADSALAT